MFGYNADDNVDDIHQDHHCHDHLGHNHHHNLYLSTADDVSYPGGVAQHICVNLLSSDSD